jgi:ribosomal-protein-alanine N-acetyltransferase
LEGFLMAARTSEPHSAIIRAAAADDADAIDGVLSESPEASSWLGQELRTLALSAMTVWVSQEGNEITGLIAARSVGEEAEIFDLAVAKAWRRRGIGRALVEFCIARMRDEGAKRVFLEVRESNTGARAFYEALGFSQAGRRPKYYRDPEEDGLLLTRPF